jgi:beta-lactamase class A
MTAYESPRSGRRSYLPALAGPLMALTFAACGVVAAHRPPPSSAQPPPAVQPVRPTPALRPLVPPPPELQERVNTLAEGFGEPVGVAIADVATGWVAVSGDELFPQQSVSKLWVAVSVLDGVDRGEIALDQAVVMTDQDRSVFYQPIVRNYRQNSHATTVRDLLARAITESDNAANDRLITLLGGADAVSRVLDEKGLDGIRIGADERALQTRIAGLAEWKYEYGFGQAFKMARAALPDADRDAALRAYLDDPADGASPAAIVRALSRLKRGELLSAASTEFMLGLMAQTKTGPRRLLAGLPRGWTLAHKTGTGQDWRGGSIGINDVGLATGPDGRTYAVAVMMRRTFKPVPARLAFMQRVSRELAAWAQTYPAPGPNPSPSSMSSSSP